MEKWFWLGHVARGRYKGTKGTKPNNSNNTINRAPFCVFKGVVVAYPPAIQSWDTSRTYAWISWKLKQAFLVQRSRQKHHQSENQEEPFAIRIHFLIFHCTHNPLVASISEKVHECAAFIAANRRFHWHILFSADYRYFDNPPHSAALNRNATKQMQKSSQVDFHANISGECLLYQLSSVVTLN